MIVDLLDGRAWLPPVLLVTLVVLGPVIGRWSGQVRCLAWWLTGAAWVAVAGLTLAPDDRRAYTRCTVQWSLPEPARTEVMANVVLFVAPVMFLGIVLRRPLAAVVLGGAMSIVIEAAQATFTVVGRSCDTTDLLSNTIGAVIGAGIAAAALRDLGRHRHGPVNRHESVAVDDGRRPPVT
jgi:VanZ like family